MRITRLLTTAFVTTSLVLVCGPLPQAQSTGIDQTPIGSSTSTTPLSTTPPSTTLAGTWTAQVVPTQDLGTVVGTVPVDPSDSSTTTSTKLDSPPKRAAKKAKRVTSNASTTTLVRLLPTTTTPKALVASDVVPRALVGTTEQIDDAFAKLRKCESGNRYDLNTGNGYYGAYQFAAKTWQRLGYSGFPHEAEPAVQDEAARKLQAKSGWGQWPACTRKIGLR